MFFLGETRQFHLTIMVSCLSHLRVFEEAVTRMMDEDPPIDAINLDFPKTFVSFNHRFL